MIVSLDPTGRTIHKVATTAAEAERLDREAAVLRVARHPGVVQLRDHRGDRLEVGAVIGRCLSDIGPVAAAEVAGVGSAVATTLADLHDLGIVHGSVEASHVLLGSDRRPVLCSLGHGRLLRSATGPAPEDDVVALVDMLLALLRSDPLEAAPAIDDVRRILCHRRRLAWRQVPTARQLAGRLAAVPDAALPNPDAVPAERVAAGPAINAGPTSRPAPAITAAKRWAVAGAVGMAATVAAGFLLVPSSRRSHPLGPVCPKVDRGCGPVDHRDGVVATDSGRYSLGGAGSDPLVLGRWTCGPALPALLRVDRGEVWVWDRWPADGGAVAARLAERVEGAETLRVVVAPSGCDHLAVVHRDGAVTAVPANLS